MGIRSTGERRFWQLSQCDGGDISDFFAGRRSMQTLRKLPMVMPSKVKMINCAISIYHIVPARRVHVNVVGPYTVIQVKTI
jgi:hypothetical protein